MLALFASKVILKEIRVDLTHLTTSRYPNADLNTSLYLCAHIKAIP